MKTERIVEQCLLGQEGAWEMLVNAYSKKIFNMAYQFAGSYEAAEDLTQDIFAKLFHSLPKYDFNKNFSAWFLTLTKNFLIDNYRKTKWEKQTRDEYNDHLLKSDPNTNPEVMVLQKENRKLVWEGFNHLSNEIRIAVILRDIQGKKYEEIAEIMNLPVGTIKSRVNRGRIQLAKILKNKREE